MHVELTASDFGKPREPGYYLGTIEVNGTEFHVELARVVQPHLGLWEAWQPPDGTPTYNGDRVDALYEMASPGGGPLRTIQVPGLEGEYLCWITPYC